MAAESQRVCLLLADLSGYTAYLAASEPERAPTLVADLVETIVRQLRPTFRLEKLEGDAAFMVAPLDGLTGEALLDAIDATMAAFQARLLSMAQATTCTCDASPSSTSSSSSTPARLSHRRLPVGPSWQASMRSSRIDC